YAAQAAANGAAAVVCERTVDAACPQICVEDTRTAFAYAAAAFYGHAHRKLKLFGITGTNGKTTTSYILAEILREAGENVGLIGTNCIRYGDVCEPAALTTPDPVQLHAAFARMCAAGATAVVMEVSAHALALRKTAGIVFDVAGFTNLSQDHLDYFGNMLAYGNAKRKLFCAAAAKCAAVNADDPFGREILRQASIPVLGYGYDGPADVFGIDLAMSAEGLQYIINLADDIGTVKFALPGRFNMYNTLCAAAMAKLAGINTETILRGIRRLKRVDGRYNVINAARFSVIIDFAHTDDGLKNIITSVREFAQARVLTVFGCGGNRDRTKRAAMGRVASSLSDITVLTSDNPRDEDPADIISDALCGVPPERRDFVYTEPDRKKAIALAFSLAQKGDVVLVAGKGAERYQEIKGIKHAYNDEEYIMEILGAY
ncbi:MAG: UDP-N-acetylmuramoyl-L-alanyl-D-glutamate--2,6-diaminopimelate ligase, partial [Clostridiales bacterium]|nr:UDP-N-acetylmuramoyl-L-alanyl-D-glutamate--2,6-diaminopimelate ligase [Clostridiales bacterium]